MLGQQMTFYCTKETDGTIHVQNAIMGMMGQHHVHTPEDFDRWKADIDGGSIDWLSLDKITAPCDCGLQAGEIKSGR